MTGTSRLPSSGTPRCLESAPPRIRRTTGRGTVIDACLSYRRKAFSFRNQSGATARSAKQLWSIARVDLGSTSCLTAMLSNLSHRTFQPQPRGLLFLLHVTSRYMGEREVRQRVADHRKRLRRQGLRPVQIWVPDVRAPGFAAEAHRQSALAAVSAHEADDQAFVDAISSLDDDEDGE
jgi:hypothetical protein